MNPSSKPPTSSKLSKTVKASASPASKKLPLNQAGFHPNNSFPTPKPSANHPTPPTSSPFKQPTQNGSNTPQHHRRTPHQATSPPRPQRLLLRVLQKILLLRNRNHRGLRPRQPLPLQKIRPPRTPLPSQQYRPRQTRLGHQRQCLRRHCRFAPQLPHLRPMDRYRTHQHLTRTSLDSPRMRPRIPLPRRKYRLPLQMHQTLQPTQRALAPLERPHPQHQMAPTHRIPPHP